MRDQPSYALGKQIARQIFMAAMAALDVRRAMARKLRFAGGILCAGEKVIPLPKPPRIVAFGKAATGMAAALSAMLGGQVEAGVVVAPAEPARKLERFRYFVGGHPYPSPGSLNGAAAALEMVSGLTRDDAVIFLVSGGGSAILEKPLDSSLALSDLVEFNQVLVTGGLRIEQMNVLRKHLSAVKGGRLAVAAYPARQLTIYLSDVPEHLPAMVASGPTLPDESTRDQCYELAEQYELIAKFPPRIRHYFEQHTLQETPKPGDSHFADSASFCLLSNRDAVEAARTLATERGFHAEIESGHWDADYKQVVESALLSLHQCAQAHPGKPVCLVAGGEVTCPVTGNGVGGRNLSFALYAAQKIEGRTYVVLSGATDGRDGNSPSSGAVADGQSVRRARALGLDPLTSLARSDAYHFFRALGDTIETRFTENNLRDLRLLLSFRSC